MVMSIWQSSSSSDTRSHVFVITLVHFHPSCQQNHIFNISLLFMQYLIEHMYCYILLTSCACIQPLRKTNFSQINLNLPNCFCNFFSVVNQLFFFHNSNIFWLRSPHPLPTSPPKQNVKQILLQCTAQQCAKIRKLAHREKAPSNSIILSLR